MHFELADPVKLKPFDPEKLVATSARERPHAAIPHARFLVAEKLIEGK